MQRPRSNGAVCREMLVWKPVILNAWAIQISATVARFRGNVRSCWSGGMPLIERHSIPSTKGVLQTESDTEKRSWPRPPVPRLATVGQYCTEHGFSSTKMSWKAAVNELFIIFLYNNGFCLTNRNEYVILKVFSLTNNERRIRCHESAIHRFFTACLHREDRCRTSAIFPVRQKRTETLLPEPMK